jgi:hypothetical protein
MPRHALAAAALATILGFSPGAALAADARLDEVCDLLLPVRAHPQPNSESRGATPAFDLAKRKLSVWIEARLADLPRQGGDVDGLARALNDELTQAMAGCDRGIPPGSDIGAPGPVRLRIAGGDLIAAFTTLGITCGVDESAYLFAWLGSRWTLVWRSEQTVAKDGYKPQSIADLKVDPLFSLEKAGDRLLYVAHDDLVVATAGYQTWCTSPWHQVYYRLWQLTPPLRRVRQLVDGDDVANIGDRTIAASLGSNEATFEFMVPSVDLDGTIVRRAVRRFRVSEAGAVRMAPIAYVPRDFIEEWLVRPWAESSAWSEPIAHDELATWHATLHRTIGKHFVSFIGTAQHCRVPADAWQIGLDVAPEEDSGAAEHQAYFLVRWHPLYRMTLLQIAAQPWPDCDEPDAEADRPPSNP